MSQFGERIQAALSAYYDWVDATDRKDGTIQVRVGKQNPTEEDITQFLLRLKEEMDNGEAATEIDVDIAEIIATVSPLALPTAEETASVFLKRLKAFAGALDVTEDDKLDITNLYDLKVKTASVIVPCEGLSEARRKSELIKRFFEESGFERVSEDATEDTYVSHNGMLGRANFFQSPAAPSAIRVSVHIPKSVNEANLIRKHYGLSEAAFLRPELHQQMRELWDGFNTETRVEILQRKAGVKEDRAAVWAKHSFEEILDMHPFLAQRLAKETVGVRV